MEFYAHATSTRAWDIFGHRFYFNGFSTVHTNTMCIHFRSKRSAYQYGGRPKRIKMYSYYTFPQTKTHQCGFEEYIKPFISVYSSPRKQNDEAFFIQSDKTFRLRVRMRTFTTDCLSSSLPLVYSSTQQLLRMVPMLLHFVVYSSWCTH